MDLVGSIMHMKQLLFIYIYVVWQMPLFEPLSFWDLVQGFYSGNLPVLGIELTTFQLIVQYLYH